jgi:hypothetical protein
LAIWQSAKAAGPRYVYEIIISRLDS